MLEVKPIIGLKAVTQRGVRVIVTGYPLKAKHIDKVWVFKGNEFGCNAIIMTRFVNLTPATFEQANEPIYNKLQTELEQNRVAAAMKELDHG